ncbi:MAG: DUF507 family protein [Myxococcota bacterium]|jgi:hypothetical protein|nr:DUF507 family protein [Myxococcota bacterium]
MRLYEGLIPTISQELARALAEEEELLEVEPRNMAELELDIQAVLKEYVRQEREIYNLARDMAAQRGGRGNVHKLKKQLARERKFKIGDESLEYIVRQLIEAFFHSAFVEEVYGEDNELRRTITPVLKKHMEQESEVHKEVRSKIKNLEEGSAAWDIEYQKVMERLKRTKKLE